MSATGEGEATHSALFICLGNICRSQMAEAVFGKHLRFVNSAQAYC